MKNIIIILTVLTIQLNAQMLISPFDAMTQAFGNDIEVSKKNILLTNAKSKNITKDAKLKLDTKIFRIFIAKVDSKRIGYGILVSRKVRSKNSVVLYIIDNNSTLKTIEIIAFNEPQEYIPSKTWQSQFKEVSTNKRLYMGKDIPTITGATLSARSIVDGSRLAFAIYDEVLKGK